MGQILRRFRIATAALLGASVIGAASAAHSADPVPERFEPPPEAPESTRQWDLIISPYVWAASLSGNAELAGFSTDVDVPFSETLDHLDLAAMGTVELTNGLWGGYIDGMYVKTSQGQNLLSREIGLDVEMTTVQGGLFYRVYEAHLGGDTVVGRPRRFAIEPKIGLRWTRLEAKASVGSFSATRSSDWLDPFVGARFNYDMTRRWNLSGDADIGGFGAGTELSVNAQAYLGYRMWMFGQPTVLRAGYRVLWEDYEAEDFTGNTFRWEVARHGPVLGFSMRF